MDVKVYKCHSDKSIFQSYKDTEKPYPLKAALPEKLSTLGKSPDFALLKLGIIPENKG